MANRPLIPVTEKFISEFISPRGPRSVPPVGTPAPDFALPSAQYFIDADGQPRVRYGETIRLSDQRGHPVVLDLSRIASDRLVCPNCAPHLDGLRDTYEEFLARGARVLVVSTTDLEMTSYVAEMLRAPYPILSNPDWSVFADYGMGSGFGIPLPGTFLIDPDGIIRWSWVAPFSPFFTPPSPATLLDLLDQMKH